MNIYNKILNFLYKKQIILEFVIIFLFCSLVSFQYGRNGLKLFIIDFPTMAILFASIIAVCAFIWLKIEKRKSQQLINELKKKINKEQAEITPLLSELSLRQIEVFDLILQGKSNKEILIELNIELSTLKTHINQIYKILGIKNRREAQQFKNQVKIH